MGAIVVIIVLVAVLSIYEYFTSRTWQQVTSNTRNDIVFEHRNKEYGAYVIRNNYDKRMLIILASVFAALALTYGSYQFFKENDKVEEEEEIMDLTQVTLQAKPDEQEIPPPPPPPEQEIPPTEKMVAFVEPVVVDEPITEEHKISDDVNDEKAGDEDQKGGDLGGDALPPPPPPDVEVKAPEILTFVEESAEFPGGRGAMMQFLNSNIKYPQVAIENEIQGKCYLRFVVSPDGSISQVTVTRGVPDCPECDKEAVRVVKSMPNWKPGKNGGKAVHSYFTLPVNFSLQ